MHVEKVEESLGKIHGKRWHLLGVVLLLIIFLSSCASIRTKGDDYPSSASAILGSQTASLEEGPSEGAEVMGQREKGEARGHGGLVGLKDVIGALVVALLSPGTWSAIFQVIAGRGFWP